MSALLKKFIVEVVAEMQDHRVPNQLVPSKGPGKQTEKKPDKDSEEETEEMDEMNVVGNIAGFTGPLGASSEDMGKKPVSPGGRTKKRKKSFARWK